MRVLAHAEWTSVDISGRSRHERIRVESEISARSRLSTEERELVPYRQKKRRALSPALVRFQEVLDRSFLMSDLEHHRQCECAALIRSELPIASNPARGGAGKDTWTGYCLHIGDMPG